jgi:type II secretion system protein N
LSLARHGRLALKVVGYSLLAVVTFVFALQLTFPYGRLKEKLAEVLDSRYEVTIGSIHRGIMPGRFSLEGIKLQSRPSKSNETPTIIYLQQLDVDLGIFALLRGTADVDLSLAIGGATIDGSVRVSKSGFRIDLGGRGLSAEQFTPLRSFIGLPMTGTVDLLIDLDVPGSWEKASGKIRFSCQGPCTFGDGESRYYPKIQGPATKDGIPFDKVNIDKLDVGVEIGDGKFVVKKYAFESKEAELFVDLEFKLARSFMDSTVIRDCIKVRGLDLLKERSDMTYSAITFSGLRGSDAMHHLRLMGRGKQPRPKLSDVRALPELCADKDDVKDDVPPRPDRPVLSGADPGDEVFVQPEKAGLPASGASSPPPSMPGSSPPGLGGGAPSSTTSTTSAGAGTSVTSGSPGSGPPGAADSGGHGAGRLTKNPPPGDSPPPPPPEAPPETVSGDTAPPPATGTGTPDQDQAAPAPTGEP